MAYRAMSVQTTSAVRPRAAPDVRLRHRNPQRIDSDDGHAWIETEKRARRDEDSAKIQGTPYDQRRNSVWCPPNSPEFSGACAGGPTSSAREAPAPRPLP